MVGVRRHRRLLSISLQPRCRVKDAIAKIVPHELAGMAPGAGAP